MPRRAAPAILFAAALVAGATGFARAAAPVRIELRAQAAVQGTVIRLGDIAAISGADAATLARLEAIEVGAAPRQGYTETLGREQIEPRVRDAGMEPEWSGAAAARIRGKGQHLAAERLADEAVRALHGALAGQYTSIALRPLGSARGIEVPAGTLVLSARAAAPHTIARRMSALVDVLVDGHVYTTVPVWFAVNATRDALVARAPLGRGDTPGLADFTIEPIDVAALTAPALAPTAALDGLRLRRPLPSGGALAADAVERRPAVQRALPVAVRVVQGTVTIETTGVALADARLGETVQVRNPKSQEAYAARVVGEGRVLVAAR